MTQQQIALFDITDAPDPRDDGNKDFDIHNYETYIIAFSGGKDSVVAFLSLLEQGVPRSKIELMHHRVDGYSEDEKRVFDWPVTDAYVQAFADAFGVKVYFSGKVGGIAGEMFRTNERTKPMLFETPDGVLQSGGEHGKKTTRRMFPAVSADLGRRFCSSYVKISVGAAAITGQTRFCKSRSLFISGERADESRNRANYAMTEPHRTDRRNGKLARHVDHHRPVLKWTEKEVYDCMKRWGVRPHPAYALGFGRCSCALCIFASKDQLATIRMIDPAGFEQMAQIERDLDHTMKQGATLHQVADTGSPYAAATPERAAVALSREYHLPILMGADDWTLPAGAFGDTAGPV